MKEMLDVIDEAEEVVGHAERDECHRLFLRHKVVQIFVFDPKGNIFVQKRSVKKDVFPGLYEASVSGHVKEGEAYEQAATRELAEELGIAHPEHELTKLFTIKLLVKPEHVLIQQFSMQCECVGKLEKGEVESGKFMTWGELLKQVEKNPANFTPGFIAALEKYETMQEVHLMQK